MCWQQQHRAVLIVGEAYFIVIVKMPIDERNKGPVSENNNLASHNYDLVSQNNVLSHDWEKFLERNELQRSDNYLQPVAWVTCFTGTGPLHQQHNSHILHRAGCVPCSPIQPYLKIAMQTKYTHADTQTPAQPNTHGRSTSEPVKKTQEIL